ncbi:MAG: hypothetical protein ABR602_06525 [Gemmatimonadales bacterium]
MYDHQGALLAIIRWPPSRRVVTDDDRLAAASFAAIYNARNSEEVRQQFATMTRTEYAEAVQMHLPMMSFAAVAPEVTALYGAGQCIWISGFRGQDNLDGTAGTWVGVNVRTGQVAAIIRLPGPDIRVRHLSRSAVFGKVFGADGEQLITRYSLPSNLC